MTRWFLLGMSCLCFLFGVGLVGAGVMNDSPPLAGMGVILGLVGAVCLGIRQDMLK